MYFIMFCTVPMTDSHVKKLEVMGMKMCSRHIPWETEHHREVHQSDTVQSDVDVYVKRTIKNTSEVKHWRWYHLGEEEEKTVSRDWSAVSIGTTKDDVCDRTIIIKWEWVEE